MESRLLPGLARAYVPASPAMSSPAPTVCSSGFPGYLRRRRLCLLPWGIWLLRAHLGGAPLRPVGTRDPTLDHAMGLRSVTAVSLGVTVAYSRWSRVVPMVAHVAGHGAW